MRNSEFMIVFSYLRSQENPHEVPTINSENQMVVNGLSGGGGTVVGCLVDWLVG